MKNPVKIMLEGMRMLYARLAILLEHVLINRL